MAAPRPFQVFQNDPNIARFVVEGTTTGSQLGIGSYGSVEEVNYSKVEKSEIMVISSIALKRGVCHVWLHLFTTGRSQRFNMCWKEDPRGFT